MVAKKRAADAARLGVPNARLSWSRAPDSANAQTSISLAERVKSRPRDPHADGGTCLNAQRTDHRDVCSPGLETELRERHVAPLAYRLAVRLEGVDALGQYVRTAPGSF